jgi:ParB family chromosome partitioning protein
MTNLAEKPAILTSLASLVLAPENARFHLDTADDNSIPDLANSLAADSSGQLLPLFVRNPFGAEPDGVYVLDGRRRMAAFNLLLEAKRIAPDHLIAAILCETEEEIAAACVIANSHRAELSHADALIAINKQTAAGRSLDAISKILCVDIKEVARLAKLGGLDIRFLQAFKANKLHLSTLKKLSALTDPDALNALAQSLQVSGYLYPHQIDRYLAIRESIESPVFNYISVEEYRAKGGRVEEDLFESVGDAILDPKTLYDLFESKFKKTLKTIRSSGVEVVFLPALKHDLVLPDREQLPYDHDSSAPVGELEALDERIEAAMLLAAGAFEAGSASDGIAHANGLLKLRFEKAKLEVAPVELAAIQFGLSASGQVEHLSYVREADYLAYLADQEAAQAVEDEEGGDGQADADNDDEGDPVAVPAVRKPVEDIEVETEGLSAAVHGRLSMMAGMGLARTLSADPMVALDIMVSTMFSQVSTHFYCPLENFVVQIRIGTSVPRNGDAVFLKPIADPLKVFIDAWIESGKHSFVFVQEMAMHEKLELMALVIALQVSTSEASISGIRKKARFEAALLSDALGHDMSSFWAGDEAFYSQFTKAQLGDFLKQMDTDPDDFAGVKKDRLVREVTELATARKFVPPHLQFKRSAEPQPAADEVDADLVAGIGSEPPAETEAVPEPASEEAVEELAA